jgi:hypothetical protein
MHAPLPAGRGGNGDVSIFQRLYDSEIYFRIESFRHGHFRVFLFDEMDGHRAMGSCRTWDEVERWLDRYARIHYPKSGYALSAPPLRP